MTGFPVKDYVKGTPYEKMKLRPGDEEKIERHHKNAQKQKRRLDTDESVNPLRLLARKLVERYRDGNKGQ